MSLISKHLAEANCSLSDIHISICYNMDCERVNILIHAGPRIYMTCKWRPMASAQRFTVGSYDLCCFTAMHVSHWQSCRAAYNLPATKLFCDVGYHLVGGYHPPLNFLLFY